MKSPSHTAKKYASMQIQTASTPRIICMLHARCVQLIHKASEPDESNTRLLFNKAQNILAELERLIIVDDETSQGLFYLYDYCYCLLERNDPHEHKNALSIMTELRDTFEMLLKNAD